MTTLKFADIHNMVVFLAKPAESKGFEQIVDFLNAHTIKYALTINPTIYTSCIKQFWAIVKAKTVNGEVQLQALVDGKKIIITESTVRRDLQWKDAKGVDCLPNATIFKELTRMSAKTTAWNEFNSTMASAIISLVTNQKFNFSKYIFESMVKNLDNVGKFLYIQEEMGEGSTMPTDPHHTPTIIQPLTSQPKKTQKPRRPKRKDTKVPQPSGPITNVVDEAINEEMYDRLVRATTTASSLEAEQDNDIYLVNVHTNEDMFGVNDLDGDEVIVDNVDVVKTIEETRSVVEEVTAVIEKAKLVSAVEETVNVATTIVSTTSTIPVSAATTTTTTVSDVEITLAQALAELKSAKPKVDKVVIQELEQGTTTSTVTTTTVATTITTASTRPKAKGIVIHEQDQAPTLTVSSQQPSHVKVQDKGKGKMVESEPMKKMSKKYLLMLDEELAFKLQAEEEEEEEERLAREKAQQIEEVNIAWDDVQAKIKADYQLAQRLQAQKQAELSNEEKARLFVQFLKQRRKHFAAKRAEKKRNRPPIRAQQRSIMCTYLKNMEGWKPKSLKNKFFANIPELFEKVMKRVNTFVEYRTELVEESSMKAETKQEEMEEDKESEELKQCLEIVLDDGDDVTIDATPLSIKSPTIVDYKIYQEGKKSYFQIIRVDGKNQMYLTFGKMLKNFDIEDLEVLWSIVKARFNKTDLVNYIDNLLLHNLKTMFEHHVKDNVWKNQQGLVKVL
ncbi:hypothetical protein Tco_1141410 [Tanacetum coccineum]